MKSRLKRYGGSFLGLGLSLTVFTVVGLATDSRLTHVDGIAGSGNMKCKYSKPCATTCAVMTIDNVVMCAQCNDATSNWFCKPGQPDDDCVENFSNDNPRYCIGMLKGPRQAD